MTPASRLLLLMSLLGSVSACGSDGNTSAAAGSGGASAGGVGTGGYANGGVGGGSGGASSASSGGATSPSSGGSSSGADGTACTIHGSTCDASCEENCGTDPGCIGVCCHDTTTTGTVCNGQCMKQGTANCDGKCVDTSSDSTNCGKCGNPCDACGLCNAGTCAPGAGINCALACGQQGLVMCNCPNKCCCTTTPASCTADGC